MNQPPEPLPPARELPKQPRPWWVTLLIAVAVAVCLAIFALVVIIGLLLYTCSNH